MFRSSRPAYIPVLNTNLTSTLLRVEIGFYSVLKFSPSTDSSEQMIMRLARYYYALLNQLYFCTARLCRYR